MIEACRACHSSELQEVFSLGDLALSDYYDEPGGEMESAPLTLIMCRACGLVQLSTTVDRDRLFTKYHYRSAMQEAMVTALVDVVDDVVNLDLIKPGDTWLDIGANDGTLLHLTPPGVNRLAYEPATNLWPALQPTGRVVGRYFPHVRADGRLITLKQPAKVITSIACFYSATDPDLFVENIKLDLAEGGVWVNQMSYLPYTLAANNFGDICHEHLTYWTVDTFRTLVQRHGLRVTGFIFNDVNGGSFRTHVKHDDGSGTNAWGDGVTPLQLKRFKQRVDLHRTEIRSLLHSIRRGGKTVMGYGASTKGNTYLQYWGLGPDLLEFIADRNPDKHGKYTPTGQLIVSERTMRCAKPDFLLMLPYHFRDAFIEREQEWAAGGGMWIVPFPSISLVGNTDGNLQQEATTTAARD